MGGVDRVDDESDISSQGSLPLGQASPEESTSGSDSSCVGESLAEAAEMAANSSTVGGGGRRYHTRQVTREAWWLRAIAAAEDNGENYFGAGEGDSHEEEKGGGPSEGWMDVEYLFWILQRE